MHRAGQAVAAAVLEGRVDQAGPADRLDCLADQLIPDDRLDRGGALQQQPELDDLISDGNIVFGYVCYL